MVVLYDRQKLTSEVLQLKQQNKSIGFVPTMGALHAGHLSLVAQSLKENDTTVVSIYVNPTQFDNNTDLEKYPRLLEQDATLLKNLDPNIIVFAPNNDEIYGEHVTSQSFSYEGLEHQMEGKHRDGHFDGVGTILTILFDIVTPDRAYFGEKDFQQLQIVKKLVEKNDIPVKIIGHPIVREANGLAMSSRNKRLTAAQFEEASVIYKILTEVQQKFSTHSIPKLNALVKERFLKYPNLKLEYFQIAKEATLVEAKRKMQNTKYRAFIAVFCGDVRLIDNMALN